MARRFPFQFSSREAGVGSGIGEARSGAGEPEVERGSQKWIEGVRIGAGESKVDWGSHEWLACNWYPP